MSLIIIGLMAQLRGHLRLLGDPPSPNQSTPQATEMEEPSQFWTCNELR